MHYGAMACVGCKGFFRRALMKADQLECAGDNSCPINTDVRTNCRSCRFKKCLAVGMKPAAVRPNREVSARAKKKALSMPSESIDCTQKKPTDDWMKKLTVEMRTTLMNLLNIEAKVMKGDTSEDAANIYPLKLNTLREILEKPEHLKGKRSEMRYEPYRLAKNNELSAIAYRRIIAAIDWVDSVSLLIGGLTIDDKIALVKNCFAPLMVFKFASKTAAEVPNGRDILCLCNFSYVPRGISSAFSDFYHLSNGLVSRALDELVTPFRQYGMREEEIVCVSAMLVLNPLARDLSEEAYDRVIELRNRVQDTLYAVVKEARLSPQPSVCFGHILLSLPIVTSLANSMCENLQFAQTFSSHGAIPLLTDLFGCFPVEPFDDEPVNTLDTLTIGPSDTRKTYEKATQTDVYLYSSRAKKRRHEDIPLEDGSPQSFRLLQPPGNFTLTEMFDDLNRENSESFYCPSSGGTSCMAAGEPYQQPGGELFQQQCGESYQQLSGDSYQQRSGEQYQQPSTSNDIVPNIYQPESYVYNCGMQQSQSYSGYDTTTQERGKMSTDSRDRSSSFQHRPEEPRETLVARSSYPQLTSPYQWSAPSNTTSNSDLATTQDTNIPPGNAWPPTTKTPIFHCQPTEIVPDIYSGYTLVPGQMSSSQVPQNYYGYTTGYPPGQ